MAADTHTIQIGAHTHLLPDGQLWRYLNHSCAPNCRIDFRTWTVVTTRAITCNEELTFNYLTTEWDMAAPFMCQCGAQYCYGCVAGFKYLTPAQQVLLAPQCSPLLRRLWRAPAPTVPCAPLAGWRPEVHVLQTPGQELAMHDLPPEYRTAEPTVKGIHLANRRGRPSISFPLASCLRQKLATASSDAVSHDTIVSSL